jgi:hypothetical protein
MPAAFARVAALFLVCAMVLPSGPGNAAARQTMPCRAFAETGKTVCNRFLSYWEGNGGLAQQGYPVSGEFREQSDVDGKAYTVQYFERAVFELHPENKPPYDVLLSLLGSIHYKQKYPTGAAGQQANTLPGSILFPQTEKRLGGVFLEYWRTNGGLAQQGYPITNEFTEKSEIDGKTYRVQYFERAVFEYHPENKPPYNVLLSHLGALRLKAKYAGREPGDVYASLRARPLRLPVLAPGQSCPRANGRIVSPSFGPALGNGPVYPVGLGTEGMLDLVGAQEEGGWLYAKVLWVGAPDSRSARGAVLIRGRQLDGAGEIHFERGPDPANELRLHGDDRTPDAAGWIDWPSYTRLRGPGCYAYQVDIADRSLVIPFEAK